VAWVLGFYDVDDAFCVEQEGVDELALLGLAVWQFPDFNLAVDVADDDVFVVAVVEDLGEGGLFLGDVLHFDNQFEIIESIEVHILQRPRIQQILGHNHIIPLMPLQLRRLLHPQIPTLMNLTLHTGQKLGLPHITNNTDPTQLNLPHAYHQKRTNLLNEPEAHRILRLPFDLRQEV
jgi:hypothetical protein